MAHSEKQSLPVGMLAAAGIVFGDIGTLATIHYLIELNGSKKRTLADAPEHIISVSENVWFMM